MKLFLLLTFLFNLNFAFSQQKAQTLHELNTLLINTVMDDVYNPPTSGRIYAYPNIAFYECIRRDDATLSSFTGK
ncbi:MAG TPA: hypothetical protein VKH37_00725, partial [Ferruginibacter sp.]|nr:hypothetical protein [Ferruginibacter sp.]